MLTKIHHVGIAVRSADEALRFYRDALGMPVTKDEIVEDQGIRGVLLAAGEGEIELLEPTREDTGVARFLASRGEGLHHLCFATDDIEAELETARAKGLPLIDQKPRQGLAGKIAFLHPRATRGVLVELAQPPPGAASDQAPAGGEGVRELDHVVVAVSDLDAGVDIYAHNFDLAEQGRADLPALGIRNARLPIGAAFVELVTPLVIANEESGAVAEFLKNRGEGMYLVSLAVSDLDGAIAALSERGVRVSQPLVLGNSRISFLSPRVTHGVSVQLIERQP